MGCWNATCNVSRLPIFCGDSMRWRQQFRNRQKRQPSPVGGGCFCTCHVFLKMLFVKCFSLVLIRPLTQIIRSLQTAVSSGVYAIAVGFFHRFFELLRKFLLFPLVFSKGFRKRLVQVIGLFVGVKWCGSVVFCYEPLFAIDAGQIKSCIRNRNASYHAIHHPPRDKRTHSVLVLRRDRV